MKNKGFTLVELLAIIIILGVLIGISVPAVNESVKKSKEKTYKETVKRIKDATQRYVVDNDIDYNIVCITIEELVENGYLTNDAIYDNRDGTNLKEEGYVVIVEFNGDEYSYELSETCPTP